MDIRIYQPTTTNREFGELLWGKYGNSKNFDYFLSDFNKAYSFCVDNENVRFHPIAGYEEGKLRTHVALIIDKRLRSGEAFFGFLEIPEDASVFNSIWNSLIKKAREEGISVLKGPINGSIWHQYRCIKETDNAPFFKSELFCESYYYDFLVSSKPSAEIQYYSASREKYDVVLRMISEDSYKKLETSVFSIKATKEVALKDLGTIANISKTVFQNSWSYTELNEREFMQLYSSEKLTAHLNTLYLLYKGEEIIGFCSTSKEDDRTLILKTIAVLPPYRGLGLGNALAYKIHLDAKAEGFEKIIYALIREDNNIKNFPKEEAGIFRRYAAFEFNI